MTATTTEPADADEEVGEDDPSRAAAEAEGGDEVEVGAAADAVRVEERRLLGLAVLVAWIPTVCSVAWAIANGVWMAGDRSIMGVFTHDVFSKHTPLLATVSTMGNYSDAESAATVHHLGPAQFWALAIPDWAFGGRPAGLLVGALLINAGCIALVVVFTRRRLDVRAAAGMALVCTVLSYGLGPSLLRDIWTPFLGLWPLLALMVLVWSLLDGDSRALPWAVVVATFLAQIELLFVAPAGVLSLLGGAGLLGRRWALRRRRRRAEAWAPDGPAAHPELDDDAIFTPTGPVPTTVAGDPPPAAATPAPGALVERPDDLVPLRHPVVVSLALALWLWSPVAWDEINGRPGNLTLLWRALHEQQARAGWTFVWHNVVAQLQVPPVWMRRADSPFDVGSDIGAPHILSALGFFGLYVALTVVAGRGRRERPTAWALMLTGYGVLLAGFVNLWITPEGGSIGLQYRRWIWPSGAYLWFAVGVTLVGEVVRRADLHRLRDAPPRRVAAPLLAVALLVCIPAGLGQLSPPSEDVADNEVIESMWGPLLERTPAQPTYLSLDGARSAFGIGPEILRRMVVHGFTIRIPEHGTDSFGEHRLYTPANGEVAQQVSVVTGDQSMAPPTDPVALLAAGRRDGRSGERYVALMQPILARAQGAAPIVVTDAGRERLIRTLFADRPLADGANAVDDLLAHPARAVFDTTLVALMTEGQVTSSPMSPTEAAAVLEELEPLGAIAYLGPPPPFPEASEG